jgi:hypothetical protein
MPEKLPLKTTMRPLSSFLILSVFMFAGCPQPRHEIVVVHVGWQQQPIKIVGCQPVVEYSGRGFSFKGVDVPVPQLGGTVKVGGFDYKPQTLNTLYRNVAILDALRLEYCGDRVAAAQTSQAAFQACNERIMQQEEKIAYLAMSATQGEAAVEEAVHKYGTASPSTTTPTNPATKKLDNAAAIGAKQKAEAPAGPEAPAEGPASGTLPTTSTVPAPLPPQVAAVVKNVPEKTLLKMARQPAPPSSSMAHQ